MAHIVASSQADATQAARLMQSAISMVTRDSEIIGTPEQISLLNQFCRLRDTIRIEEDVVNG